MKKILIEKDIQSFFVFENSLIFLKNKNIFQDEKLILIEIESFGIKNEFVFFHKHENDNLVSIQLNHNNELVIHNYPIDAEICFENNAFLGLNYDRLSKTYEYFCYNLLNKTIKKVNNFNSNSIHHKVCFPYIIYKTKNQFDIGSYHLPTETTLWQYSVTDLGAEKVSKILGVFGQTLVVVCEMPVYPEHILIGIDINDGKLLWSVNLSQYLMHSNLFYHEQNNSIISLRRNFLWEFSLSSMEVIREKQLPETFNYKSLNVQVELASLYGDLIYFAGKDLENIRPSALVGVFDLKTEKLVDVHDLQSDGTFTVGGNSRPQVSGNKIYVQDTKNTLHILERED